MELIKEAVQNLIVYMLLVTVILNLVKTSSYKKYIELFTGLVLILILFTPAARLFGAEDTLGRYLEDYQFRLETRDSAEFIYEAEKSTKEQLLQLYEEKVTERIKNLGERNNIQVESVETSLTSAEDGFGAVEKIKVRIAESEEKEKFQKILSEAFELSEKQVVVK